jgi:hypothetical protein
MRDQVLRLLRELDDALAETLAFDEHLELDWPGVVGPATKSAVSDQGSGHR